MNEWTQIEFQDFIEQYDPNLIIKYAPTIMHSKRDKEPEAFKSLIFFLFILGFLLIYIAISIIFISVYFNSYLFYSILGIAILASIFFLYNYIKSNVNIKLKECWFEIYEYYSPENGKYYAIIYYPVFTGKSHPNKAKNIIYKLYQDELVGSKLDIGQIEFHFKFIPNEDPKLKPLGYFFLYGQGVPFKNEEIDRNKWKYFPINKTFNQNYFATANWDHQFEWREELELDYDKLHSYSPWILHKWDESSLKPLTKEYKKKLNIEMRPITAYPGLMPWKGNLQDQTIENFKAYKDLQIMNEVIEKIIGIDVKVKKLKDLNSYLFKIQAYFRDLIV